MLTVAGLLLLAPVTPARAEKTDVVILKNGDRVTGEVKALERGRLSFSTDSMGSLQIEWEEIEKIDSGQNVEVEVATGEKFFGSLTAEAEAGRLQVRGETESVTLELASVVRMVPIEDTFLRRLDGSFDLGFSFTSANDATQYSLGSNVRYRTRRFSRHLGLSSTFLDQRNAERTRRTSLEGGLQRFLANRRFTNVVLQFQQNEELGLELRSLVAAGYGRHAVQSNNLQLDLFAGLALNSEDFQGFAPSSSTEVVGGLQFAVFKFDDPETDVRASLFVFPSLSNPGRVRAELEARLRREIVKDFFFSISLYDSYDSEPPLPDLPTNDWGTSSSLGWSF